MPTKEELRGGFNLGEWEIFPEHGEIRRGETVVQPEPQTWSVLLVLAEEDGKLVSNDDLNQRVWGGRAMMNDPITRQIREVRKIFGDSAKKPVYLETQHKRGYRLLLPVELHKPAAQGEDAASAAIVGSPVLPQSIQKLVLWKAAAVLLVIGALAIAAYNEFSVDPPVPPMRSIAVMPFMNLSGDASDAYLVSGFKEELIVMLASIGDFTVKPVQLSYPMEATDVAEFLNVESLLEGSLRRSGDEIKISYRVSKGNQGVIHSGDVTGSVDRLFELQETLADMVRDKLLGKYTQILIKSRPSGNPGYERYMRGIFALEHRGDAGNLESAVELLQQAIELDPDFGPSYLALATAYALIPTYRRSVMSASDEQRMDKLALQTIEAGIAADPAIFDAAGAIYGYIYHKQKRWKESEAAYLRAVSADVVDSNSFNWYSRMLASVGRLEASLQQSSAALEVDPTSAVINSRVAMGYTWLMEDESALEYYERSNKLGWSGEVHLLGYALILYRLGKFEKASEVAKNSVKFSGGATAWIEPVFAALADPTDPEKRADALAALNSANEGQSIAPQVELTLRASFGDLDGAMRVARLLEGPGELFEMDLLFLPEVRPLRQHPDFMPLLDRLGVTAYWKSKGCVWRDDRVSCQSG